MFKRIIIALGVALALLASSFTVTPEPADAAIFKRYVVNSAISDSTLTVCRVKAANGTCRTGLGTLRPGENTRDKYGWSAADLIRIGPGCNVTATSTVSLKFYNNRNGKTGYWKGIWPSGRTNVLTDCK